MISLIPLGQFEVITNDNLCIKKEYAQYRFPKSRNKRIRRKWSKRNINYKIIDKHYVWRIENKIYMSTKMRDKMMLELNAKNKQS